MDLHLVHFNKAYGDDISEAIQNSGNAWDTLAVLGVLFQVQDQPNHNLDFIIQGMLFIVGCAVRNT